MSSLRAAWLTNTLGALLSGVAVGPLLAETLEPVADYEHLAKPLIERYCFDCHSGDAPDAGLALHKLEGAERFQTNRATWQKVLNRLRAGSMPPSDSDAPSDSERAELITWIEARLAEFDCRGPHDPGWITLRRLNRDQYRSTISDLLQVDFEPAKTFPPDELAHGFDNNADMLSLTPLLLEKYLAAAREISRQAVLTPESVTQAMYVPPKNRWQGGHFDAEDQRELWADGAIEFVHKFSHAGTYWLRVTVEASQAGDEPVIMGMLDDSRVVKRVAVHAGQGETEQFTMALDAATGKRRLGVALLNDFHEQEADRNLFVKQFELIGPARDTLAAAPAAHRQWFANPPSVGQWRDQQRWRPAVRETLKAMLASAFRRPATKPQVDRLISLIDARRRAGDTYQRAMQVALEATLVSPRFLFIGNLEAPTKVLSDEHPGHLVDDFELASRLSYFLWSSMPDDRLRQLAGEGQLRTQLDSQVARMLADPRARQFTDNFAGQWLGTRELTSFQPDENQFGEFDNALRDAMAREAELVFAEVVHKNLPITTLLHADFTYLNARLAKHYGLAGDYDGFERVSLASQDESAGPRGGVLTMAGVLAVTSNPNRTSPVKRGKWVLGELLGAEPPAPPPGIDSLESVAERSEEPLSIRQQMERHRADPSCVVCHQQMDSIGLALENYDVVGRWRTHDAAGSVDASGEFPGGQKINGVADLQRVLLGRRDEFRKCLTQKMLTYALGRGLEYYDQCAVGDICNQVYENGDRMQSLIMAIIQSAPFQQRRYNQPPTPQHSAAEQSSAHAGAAGP